MMETRTCIVLGLSLFLVVGLGAGSLCSETSSITIASFNIKDFGYAGQACKSQTQLDQLAILLSSYDLIALQEVMQASTTAQSACYRCEGTACHIEQLVKRMRLHSGHVWEYVCTTPPPYGTRYEYYVILYNTTTVTYLGEDADRGTCSRKQDPLAAFTVRPPMYAYFRSGDFDFIVLNYHAPSKEPEADATLLWTAFTAVPSRVSSTERDVILLGDFNLSHPERFLPSEALRLVYGGTTSAQGGGEPYDTIFIDSRHTRHEYTGFWGINTQPITKGLSNHAIVWARFWTHLEDDD